MDIQVAGENALIIYFGDHMSADIAARVQQATTIIERELDAALVDMIPSYASLLVVYRPQLISYRQLRNKLKTCLIEITDQPNTKAKEITLPVYYERETGPDLDAIAAHSGLDIDEVIALHSNRLYRVYAIGFAPGFAYLGEVDSRIAMPRQTTPRLNVPKGSVAIADRQTAVYPCQSPGGWNIIGRCPVELFSPAKNPPIPVSVGDWVRFEPISREQFLVLGGAL